MPRIDNKNENHRASAPRSPAFCNGPSRSGPWKHFTSACARIAETFLSESNRFCGDFASNPTSSNKTQTTESNTGADPDAAFTHLEMLVSDKVVKKKRSKRRISTARLMNSSQEFKSSLSTFHANLKKTLPTIVEKDEYKKSSSPTPVKPEVKVQNLAAQISAISAMWEFDFSGSPNPFPAVLTSYAPVCGSNSARQQMLTSFRGKIIAENFKVTGLLDVHNDKALTKLLAVLKEATSDNSVSKLEELTPEQAYVVFDSFCKGLGVSAFRKGFGEI